MFVYTPAASASSCLIASIAPLCPCAAAFANHFLALVYDCSTPIPFT